MKQTYWRSRPFRQGKVICHCKHLIVTWPEIVSDLGTCNKLLALFASPSGSQNVLSPYKQEDTATEERINQILSTAQAEMQNKATLEKVRCLEGQSDYYYLL